MLQKLTALASTSYVLLGNVCMMPVAQAADMMHMPSASHEAMTEQAIPIFSSSCTYGDQGQRQKVDDQKLPCDNGDCFSDSSLAGVVRADAYSSMEVVSPPPCFVFSYPIQDKATRPKSHAPRNPPVSTTTIVLLF